MEVHQPVEPASRFCGSRGKDLCIGQVLLMWRSVGIGGQDRGGIPGQGMGGWRAILEVAKEWGWDSAFMLDPNHIPWTAWSNLCLLATAWLCNTPEVAQNK